MYLSCTSLQILTSFMHISSVHVHPGNLINTEWDIGEAIPASLDVLMELCRDLRVLTVRAGVEDEDERADARNHI